MREKSRQNLLTNFIKDVSFVNIIICVIFVIIASTVDIGMKLRLPRPGSLNPLHNMKTGTRNDGVRCDA